MDGQRLLTSNFTNNGTLENPDRSFSWGLRVCAPAVLLSLCFLVGFPGNLAVIFLRPNRQNLSKLTQGLMMNLAYSDLLCLVTLPLWIYSLVFSWTLGTAACKAVAFIVHCSLNSSLLTVTALSLQRYMQVIRQQQCLPFKKRLLVLVWLMSAALSVPALVTRQIVQNLHPGETCFTSFSSEVQQVAVLLSEAFIGFSSFFITGFTYICLKRKLNRAAFFHSARTSKLVSGIIVTFFTLWMPYFIFDLVIAAAIVQKVSNAVPFYNSSYNVFASVTFINSCLNPLLYAFAFRLCGRSTSPKNVEPSVTQDATSHDV